MRVVRMKLYEFSMNHLLGLYGFRRPIDPCAIERAEVFMHDAIFVMITLAFFAVSIGYVRFCDRVR
jgi:hypothetical protein